MQKNPHIQANETPHHSEAAERPDCVPGQAPDAAPGHTQTPSRAGGLPQNWAGSLAVFAACSALLIWAFWSEIAAAVQVWSTSRTFGHAFFIFPITLFLFYRLRHRLAALQPKAAPWAFLPIAGLTLFWMVGELANLMVVKQLAFVGLWQSLFLLVLGWRVTRAAIFPLAYLILAVPFGSSIVPALQDVTAQMVVQMLRLTGMPVFLDGYYIQIPSGSFLVAEACSGVRYLMVCIAIGILAADLFFRSWPRRLIFVGLSLLVPIVANGVRAYGIVMLAHLSDYEIAVDVDHIVYGFVFLSVVTLTLLGLGALLRDRYDPLQAEPDTAGSRQAAPSGAFGVPGQAFCGGLAIAVILLAQGWTATAKAPPEQLATFLHAPVVEPPWEVVDGATPAWMPGFHGMDETLLQSYRNGDQQIDLHIAYYDYQREGAEAISDLNTFTTDRSRWKALNFRQFEVATENAAHPVNSLIMRNKEQTYLVWYWYWIGGESTNSRFAGKLLEMKAIATNGERAAAVIAIAAKVSEDAEQTEKALGGFFRQAIQKNGMLVRVGRPLAKAGANEIDALPALKKGASEP